jgi:hypothetical protein
MLASVSLPPFYLPHFLLKLDPIFSLLLFYQAQGFPRVKIKGSQPTCLKSQGSPSTSDSGFYLWRVDRLRLRGWVVGGGVVC